MIAIETPDAIEAYVSILRVCCESSLPFSASRVGPARDLGPACFQVHGEGRLAVLVGRRINPFFALAEAWWVMRGERELAPLKKYVESYGEFSDDGETLHGAYGFRLRKYFGVDQIERAVALLSNTPDTRRVVLQMWSVEDLGAVSRDIPCNTQIALKIRQGALDMTVFNRANDAYLGVPYNIFVFGALQAYLARRLRVNVGRETHFVDSLHLYEKNLEQAQMLVALNDSRTVQLLREIAPDDLGAIMTAESDSVLSRMDEHEGIKGPLARSVLHAHAVRRDEVALGGLRLPHTQLGLAAYLWIRESKAGRSILRDEVFEPFVRARTE